MNLNELLAELAQRGVKLWAEGDQLRIRARKGAINATQRNALREHKAELLLLLRQNSLADSQALPQIVPAPEQRYEPFPLTDIQQAYWVGRQDAFESGNVATHSYSELEGKGLDLVRLNVAWQKLIERHEMLRMVVLPTGEQQILEQVPPYEIELLDLEGADAESVAAHLEAIRAQMSHQVFPTEQWPLFEIRATRFGPQHLRLHLSFDLLIVDLGSLLRLFQEWYQLYNDLSHPLPPLTVSFRDYVLAEKSLEGSDLYERSREYWQSRTLPPAPELSLANNPRSVKSRFKRRETLIARETWAQLKRRGTKAGLTPSGIVLAAFAEILTVWSKSPRFTINLTLFNRLPVHPQINEIIGDFTSVTLLAVDNSSSDQFTVRTQRLQEQLWQDLEHRYFSGVRVLRSMRQQGIDRTMPIVFTSALGLGDSGLEQFGEEIYGISQTPQVWLDHQVFEQDGNLVLTWDAVEELFPEGMLDDMFDVYGRFLRQLARSDSAWLKLSLLPAAQFAQRAAVNATEAPISEELLHTLFTAQVETYADKVAVISSAQTLTYQELYQRANQVGHQLRALEAKPNTLVAVVMEKGWEQVVAVLGILMSGAAYLPIDPTLPTERRHYLLAQGEVTVALTQAKLNQTLLWPEGIERINIDHGKVMWMSPLTPVQSKEDLAYVIYTSGSTGLPKGVMIDHQGAVNTVLDINQRFGVTDKDSVLALSALTFDLSVYDIFGLLAIGGTIVIPEPSGRRDPSHWVELMQKHQVTLWDTVPALMQMLVEYLAGRQEVVPSGLRLVMMSGDWIPVSLPDKIKTLWHRPSQEIKVISLGGATEASIWSIFYPIESVDRTWKSIPYGKPLTNQSFHVLNELMEPTPVWVPGQLYIGGIGLAKGYWRDEEKTSRSFIIDARTGERLYKTGDLGRYLPDGNIEFLGREDFQVKVSGHRIELGEIEAALIKHPSVANVVVTVVGEMSGHKQLVAYLVPEQHQESERRVNEQQVDQAAYGLEEMKDVLVDPVERLEFKLKLPGIRQLERLRPTIKLHQPILDEEAYITRQSYRQFLRTPLAFEKIGDILAVLMPQKFAGTLFPKYRYPSAGSLYPVQTYLYIKPDRVKGIAGGTYYYHPIEHELVLLSEEARIERDLHGEANRAIFDQSAFSIFLVGQLKAIEPMYGSMSLEFCLLEAGYMSQLLMEVAPANEIGLCPIGGLNFASIRDFFELDDSQVLLHTFLGGAISPAQMQQLGEAEPQPQKHSLVEQIKEYLAQKLPDYMVPKHVVLLDKLPLTPNGKVDRKSLPIPDTEATPEETIAPDSELEQRLSGILQEVLGVAVVSVTKNFFDIGANSLHLVQIYNKLQHTYPNITVTDIFRHASIRALAHYLGQNKPQPSAAVEERLQRGETRRAMQKRRLRGRKRRA